ncbi:MAG: 16S rRNA (uracil(1498)-N(3))-methyltransferase [Clostridia bacterium]|nr:16S rRNA (uracil(1498)-N(3))-methyltransferase [Clostridia bacterium]
MHRFIVDPQGIENGLAIITGEEGQHLTRVLRLKSGDPVLVFDGQGREAAGVITVIGKNQAEVALSACSLINKESPLELWLAQGIAKGEKMDLIIQKAVELGVWGIIPVETRRTVVRLDSGKKAGKQERWQKIAAEAAKQSGRSWLPTVAESCGLSEFLQNLPAEKMLLAAWEGGGEPLKALAQQFTQEEIRKIPVYLLIGPEGGLSTEEADLLVQNGARLVTLGPRILRTETAGLALTAALMYQWGDWG